MKIFNLTANSKNYTCHVYLILGDWNTLDDVNTLIDAGREPNLIHLIKNISTGVGKKPVDQVILTHCHYDHTGMITEIKKEFNPLLCAYHTYQKADICLKGGEMIKIADRMCEIIHTPGHSNDSICIYCEHDGILFSGDLPLNIRDVNATYQDDYVRVLENLASKEINAIYTGHDNPITNNAKEMILNSLRNVKNAH
jgi:glyoxylase-like metal-dependent hydrolase (beta-lactamase superfamily II)